MNGNTMQIKVSNRIPFEKLEERIRQVPLLHPGEDGKQIFVYTDANISLRTVLPTEINPTTLYLLRGNLEFQRKLRDFLMDHEGIDPLSLDGALELTGKEGNIWTLTPPIVEEAIERVQFVPYREGEITQKEPHDIRVPIICDGQHRVYLALDPLRPVTVVFISNIPPEHPFYAHPNSWSKVQVHEETPKVKKQYLLAENNRLYRNFGVLGCGAPRKPGDRT